MTSLSLSSTPAASVKVDAVVIGVTKGPKGLLLAPGADSVDDALGNKLLAALTGLGATGKAEEVTTLATLGATPAAVLVAVGLGDTAPSYDAEVLRRAAGVALRALAGTKKVALALPLANGTPGANGSPSAGGVHEVRAVGEGALLGAYSFSRFRSTTAALVRAPVESVTLLVPNAKDKVAKAALLRAVVVAEGVALARDLVNTPPSHLRPTGLAEIARATARAAGVEVEVLDEKALAKAGFGGILGVGQGSDSPPRLVHLSYKGGKGTTTRVALVGKGITFDSGGLSLKPPAAMEEMKMDMGGAAAVLAATVAAAKLGLAVDIEAWIPMAENMPSGTAIRPSDVLTMHSGKRIEVNNTDAEGRLILADAISRASQDSPDVLLDVATLTGAAIVALGGRTAGVMANDDDLREHAVEAAGRAGELAWGMPLPKELRKGLDSEIADMVNSGPREGGMLTAGLFLQEFVGEGIKWAHFDIAGPAYNSGEPYGYTAHGGTGAAVRTFVQVLEDFATR